MAPTPHASPNPAICRWRRAGIDGIVDDRRERAVEVEQRGGGGQPMGHEALHGRGEGLGRRSLGGWCGRHRLLVCRAMPGPQPSHERSRGPLTLLAIGSAAGVYSGLFGVGGGAVMVPLLILWRGMDPRVAAATSLAAIIVIVPTAIRVRAAAVNLETDRHGTSALLTLAVGNRRQPNYIADRWRRLGHDNREGDLIHTDFPVAGRARDQRVSAG